MQRLLANDYTVEVRYVYTKGVHLWNQTRMNIVSPLSYTGLSIPTFTSVPDASTLAELGNKVMLGPFATAADAQAAGCNSCTVLRNLSRNYLAQYKFPNNLTGYHPWGNSRYNGLAVQLNKRYSKNFMFMLAYTWSHGFDDSTATNFSTILSPRRAQDFQNLRAEWVSSALDRRHRFTFAPMYDFKPFQNGTWLMKNVVGNWNISFGYTFQSPEYATVQSGIDSNLNNDSDVIEIRNRSGAIPWIALSSTRAALPTSAAASRGTTRRGRSAREVTSSRTSLTTRVPAISRPA